MKNINGEHNLHQKIGWVIILALLYLRIPFTIFLTYRYPPENQLGPAAYQFGTYLLTVLFIWWERKDLFNIHVDTIDIGLIVLFKPVQTLVLRYWGIDNPIAFPHPAALLIWIVAIGFFLAMWVSRYRPRFDLQAWVWVSLGLLVGIGMSVLVNIKVFKFSEHSSIQNYVMFAPVALSTFMAFSYQIGFAAIAEEPLFRGFLWGYLRRLGLKEKWIWPIQALVFMGAHLYFKDALQFNFWVVVPLSALTFGLIAWKTRSLAPGMLAHAAYNAGAYVFVLQLIRSFK
jgi:membrane protease YdiL (CAAX protease family)